MSENKTNLADIVKMTTNIQKLNWAYQELLIENCCYRHNIRLARKIIEDLKNNEDSYYDETLINNTIRELLNLLVIQEWSDSNE